VAIYMNALITMGHVMSMVVIPTQLSNRVGLNFACQAQYYDV